jgi:PadR family transcriptional regulator, regulatory protein PadR
MKPLTTPSLYLLLCLGGEERHGYELMKMAAEVSDGSVSFGPATLYTTLQRLIEDGLIEATREETVNGRQRRYYKITGAGAKRLNEEGERMSAFVKALRKASV